MIATYWIDIFIIGFLALISIDGYRRGFLQVAMELLSAGLAFLISGFLGNPLNPYIGQLAPVPALLQRSITITVLWFVLQWIFNIGIGYGHKYIPELIRNSKANQIAGIIPSMAKGIVMIAIILTLLVTLPLQANIKQAIVGSTIGKPMVGATQEFQKQLLARYRDELNETVTFLTSTPFSPKKALPGQKIDLKFKTTDVTVDAPSEQLMLDLVNRERVKVGLQPLAADKKLQEAARAHARDMFAKGYFAHDNPDGEDPFERLQRFNITYLAAGENLALAPSVELAHIGLMNSPEHKDNILYTEFGRLGVGVIDGGIYGKMFVQEFSD